MTDRYTKNRIQYGGIFLLEARSKFVEYVRQIKGGDEGRLLRLPSTAVHHGIFAYRLSYTLIGSSLTTPLPTAQALKYSTCGWET